MKRNIQGNFQICISIPLKLAENLDYAIIINSFVPNVPFLDALKTLETLRFSDFFRRQRKGAFETNETQNYKKKTGIKLSNAAANKTSRSEKWALNVNWFESKQIEKYIL